MKIILGIIIGFIALIALYVFTGHGTRKLMRDKDLNNFLNKDYAGEKFEVLSKEEIVIPGDVGGCQSPGEGVSYQVKSLDTNIIFTVKDYYRFNSFFCEYLIYSDYLKLATEKFSNENSIYKAKLHVPYYKYLNVGFYKEDYYSKDEMEKSVVTIIDKLKSTYPFKHKSISKYITISIDGVDPRIDDLDNAKISQIIDDIYK